MSLVTRTATLIRKLYLAGKPFLPCTRVLAYTYDVPGTRVSINSDLCCLLLFDLYVLGYVGHHAAKHHRHLTAQRHKLHKIDTVGRSLKWQKK